MLFKVYALLRTSKKIIQKILCRQHLHNRSNETSIIGAQYIITVTFAGSFFNMNVSFWVENELQMSQNSKLLNLTTKAIIKRCKNSWKSVEKNATLLIIHAQCWYLHFNFFKFKLSTNIEFTFLFFFGSWLN